jgi:hypothetical protein
MWKFYDSTGTNVSIDMDLYKMWYIRIKNLDVNLTQNTVKIR